jgi:hypothetical protein
MNAKKMATSSPSPETATGTTFVSFRRMVTIPWLYMIVVIGLMTPTKDPAYGMTLKVIFAPLKYEMYIDMQHD